MIKALFWDLDGTLAETERDGHLVAFNRAFEALRVPWRWSEQHHGELPTVTGGRERLLHDMNRREEAPSDARQREALAETVHRLKNQIYAGIVRRGDTPLRAGVAELLSRVLPRSPADGNRHHHEPRQQPGADPRATRITLDQIMRWHAYSPARIHATKSAPRRSKRQ